MYRLDAFKKKDDIKVQFGCETLFVLLKLDKAVGSYRQQAFSWSLHAWKWFILFCLADVGVRITYPRKKPPITQANNFPVFIFSLFSGSTPQRRQFNYPTKLVKTEPHDVLKERFQASYNVPYSPEPQPIKVYF